MAGSLTRKMAGYAHALYAQSLAEFGTPVELPSCGGWILKRRIPGYPNYDGMGCYPLFACRDWALLATDLENVGTQLVSLAIVADPFGGYSPAYLQQCFQDVVIPFKEHFVVDLRAPADTFVSAHHRRNARKALQRIGVERCGDPKAFLNDWLELYKYLIDRHEISGIAAFSEPAFRQQLSVPGLVAFRAEHEGATVGMLLWYVQGGVGYYHLGAYNQKGYTLKASFGLFWWAIDYFASKGLRWLNLGAGVGTTTVTDCGLSRFKRGWATGTRTTYFCGRIFDPATYRQITQAGGCVATDHFPAYREGEFS
jgi:GNAT acetyltransferase-like protein